MEKKFKIGDRVRIIKNMNYKFKIGDRVRIIKSYNGAPYDVDDYYYLVAFDILKGDKSDPSDWDSQWYAGQKQLELENQLIRCE